MAINTALELLLKKAIAVYIAMQNVIIPPTMPTNANAQLFPYSEIFNVAIGRMALYNPPKPISTIKINNPLKSIEFLSGNVTVDQYAKLEYSDWQVEATYESGLKEVVDYNLLKIEYDINTAGEQDAVVSYEENNIVVTTKVKINVKEAELSFNSLFFTADSLALSDNITTTTSWYDEDGYAPNMITFTSGAKVTSNSKEADGYSFKNRLQLQKKSNIILDLAMFNGKNITIKLYAMSGNSNEIRSIELYKNEIIEQTALTSMSFDGKNLTSQEYTFNCDGSTYLIKDVDGVNVYGILITIN